MKFIDKMEEIPDMMIDNLLESFENKEHTSFKAKCIGYVRYIKFLVNIVIACVLKIFFLIIIPLLLVFLLCIICVYSGLHYRDLSHSDVFTALGAFAAICAAILALWFASSQSKLQIQANKIAVRKDYIDLYFKIKNSRDTFENLFDKNCLTLHSIVQTMVLNENTRKEMTNNKHEQEKLQIADDSCGKAIESVIKSMIISVTTLVEQLNNLSNEQQLMLNDLKLDNWLNSSIRSTILFFANISKEKFYNGKLEIAYKDIMQNILSNERLLDIFMSYTNVKIN